MFSRYCLVLIVFCLLFLSGNLAAEDQFFSFAPADSLTFSQSVFTEHVRSVDNERGLIDSIRAYYQKQFVRSPIGYDLITTPDSIVTTRNGEAIDSPISRAMALTTSRMVLDDDGHALSIEGYDKLEGNLSVDDQALMAEIKKNLNPRAMAVKETGEWNSFIDPIVGVKLEIGNLMYVQEAFQVGANSRVELFTLVECVDTFWVDNALCARIYMHSDSDFLRLAQRLKITKEKLLADFTFDKMPGRPVGSGAMRVLQIVLEVKSMQLLGILAKTEITVASTDEAGQSHDIRLTEMKDIRIKYGSAR